VNWTRTSSPSSYTPIPPSRIESPGWGRDSSTFPASPASSKPI
jgi:hypothetical protein